MDDEEEEVCTCTGVNDCECQACYGRCDCDDICARCGDDAYDACGRYHQCTREIT